MGMKCKVDMSNIDLHEDYLNIVLKIWKIPFNNISKLAPVVDEYACHLL
jgi:hypothetical protein